MNRTLDTIGEPRPARRRAGYDYDVVTRVLSWLPHPALRVLARIGGFAHYWLARDKRRAYKYNTSQLINYKEHRRPWRAFQNHALNLLEVLKATTEADEQIMSGLDLVGWEHLDDAVRAGNGLVLATFHSGNWELSGLLLALRGYPVTTVAGTQLREGWSDAIKAFKERFGIHVISPQGGMRGLYRAISSNRMVALHIDGDVFSGGIEATLLGRTVTVPKGVARLSRSLGAPSAFAYSRRTPANRIELRIEPTHAPPTNDAEEDALIRHYVDRVEKCILEDPGQWCIFRKL